MKYVLSLSLIFVSAFSPLFAIAETEAERRARLEAELQNVERQILTQSRLVEDKSKKQRESLADLVRKSSVIADYSLVEVMLSTQSFSEFFTDVATFNSIKESLNESLEILHGIKTDTIAQKDQLATKQETEAEMRRIQELQKKEIERKEHEKEQILTVTKGEEKA